MLERRLDVANASGRRGDIKTAAKTVRAARKESLKVRLRTKLVIGSAGRVARMAESSRLLADAIKSSEDSENNFESFSRLSFFAREADKETAASSKTAKSLKARWLTLLPGGSD